MGTVIWGYNGGTSRDDEHALRAVIAVVIDVESLLVAFRLGTPHLPAGRERFDARGDQFRTYVLV